jgi:hypothetical protein
VARPRWYDAGGGRLYGPRVATSGPAGAPEPPREGRMATTTATKTPPPEDTEGKHALAGVHGHAGYPSQADLETRLAAARGESAPTVEPALAPPDPAQQQPRAVTLALAWTRLVLMATTAWRPPTGSWPTTSPRSGGCAAGWWPAGRSGWPLFASPVHS